MWGPYLQVSGDVSPRGNARHRGEEDSKHCDEILLLALRLPVIAESVSDEQFGWREKVCERYSSVNFSCNMNSVNFTNNMSRSVNFTYDMKFHVVKLKSTSLHKEKSFPIKCDEICV